MVRCKSLSCRYLVVISGKIHITNCQDTDITFDRVIRVHRTLRLEIIITILPSAEILALNQIITKLMMIKKCNSFQNSEIFYCYLKLIC